MSPEGLTWTSRVFFQREVNGVALNRGSGVAAIPKMIRSLQSIICMLLLKHSNFFSVRGQRI